MFRLTIVTMVLWLLTLLAMPGQSASQDPTRPPVFDGPAAASTAVKASAPRWRLSSTIVARDRRSAVINDQVVVAGDNIAGARVVEIEAAKVTLSANGKQIVLSLIEKDIKTPVKASALQEGAK